MRVVSVTALLLPGDGPVRGQPRLEFTARWEFWQGKLNTAPFHLRLVFVSRCILTWRLISVQFCEYQDKIGIERLCSETLANGIPVIAGQLLAIDSDIGHYRVIKGYDDVAWEFISDDPLQSQGSDFCISYATFARLSTGAIIPVYPPEMNPLFQSLMQDFRAREITYCPP